MEKEVFIIDKSTFVCRCEEINVDEIETVLKQGAKTFDDIKRLTRCGMGPCQAKGCMYIVNQMIADWTGKDLSDIPIPRLRVPLRPTPIAVLTTNQTTFKAVRSVLDEVDLNER